MTRRPGGSDGPEDVDAAFAEIVAALEREGVGAALVDLEGSGDPDRVERPAQRGDHPELREPELRDPEPTEPGGMPVVRPGSPPASPPVERTPPIQPIEPIGPVTPWRGTQVPWDPDAADAEEHFVPPEPPPLPRLRPGTVFGLLLIAVGVFLLAGPSVIGLAPRIATPLALVSMATGIGWLVLRMRHGGPPSDSDRDDGAQV